MSSWGHKWMDTAEPGLISKDWPWGAPELWNKGSLSKTFINVYFCVCEGGWVLCVTDPSPWWKETQQEASIIISKRRGERRRRRTAVWQDRGASCSRRSAASLASFHRVKKLPTPFKDTLERTPHYLFMAAASHKWESGCSIPPQYSSVRWRRPMHESDCNFISFWFAPCTGVT